MASVNAFDRVDRLNSNNYRTWKFAMKMLLIQRELWKYVNRSAVLRDDATTEQKASHRSKDEKALSTIALSIDRDQQVHIVHCETASLVGFRRNIRTKVKAAHNATKEAIC